MTTDGMGRDGATFSPSSKNHNIPGNCCYWQWFHCAWHVLEIPCNIAMIVHVFWNKCWWPKAVMIKSLLTLVCEAVPHYPPCGRQAMECETNIVPNQLFVPKPKRMILDPQQLPLADKNKGP